MGGRLPGRRMKRPVVKTSVAQAHAPLCFRRNGCVPGRKRWPVSGTRAAASSITQRHPSQNRKTMAHSSTRLKPVAPCAILLWFCLFMSPVYRSRGACSASGEIEDEKSKHQHLKTNPRQSLACGSGGWRVPGRRQQKRMESDAAKRGHAVRGQALLLQTLA